MPSVPQHMPIAPYPSLQPMGALPVYVPSAPPSLPSAPPLTSQDMFIAPPFVTTTSQDMFNMPPPPVIPPKPDDIFDGGSLEPPQQPMIPPKPDFMTSPAIPPKPATFLNNTTFDQPPIPPKPAFFSEPLSPPIPPKPASFNDGGSGGSSGDLSSPPIPPKPTHFDKPTFVTEDERMRPMMIPEEVIPTFVKLAHPNTLKNTETCGILCGTLQQDVLTVTHLVIPPQDGTSDSCTTKNEELLLQFQDRLGLITMGWIHVFTLKIIFFCLPSCSLKKHRLTLRKPAS